MVRKVFPLRRLPHTYPCRKTHTELGIDPRVLLSFFSSQAKSPQGQNRDVTCTSKAWKHSTHSLQRSLLYKLIMNSILYGPAHLSHKEKIWQSTEKRWSSPGKAAVCSTWQQRWGDPQNGSQSSFSHSPETQCQRRVSKDRGDNLSDLLSEYIRFQEEIAGPPN